MPQHWPSYVMQPWEKHLKKRQCMIVQLQSWLSRTLNRAISAQRTAIICSPSHCGGEKKIKNSQPEQSPFPYDKQMLPVRELQGTVLGRVWGKVWGARGAFTPSAAPSPTRAAEQAHVGGPVSITALQGWTLLLWQAGQRPNRDITAASRTGARPSAVVRTRAKTQLCSSGDGPDCQTLGVLGLEDTFQLHHNDTSHPDQRISRVSAENYILKNSHWMAVLLLLERGTKSSGKCTWELKHINPVDTKSWAW